MTLCAQDRRLLEAWTVHGIPDDPSTRDAAAAIALKVWAAYRELDTLIDQLTDNDKEETHDGAA